MHNLYGRDTFHAIIINLSYRTRGKELRTQINKKHIKKVFKIIKLAPKNNSEVMNLKNMIIPYSLIKIKANIPPPYSILNPETISDSPSARSKGVRFLSAMHIINQVIRRGKHLIPIHILLCLIYMVSML